MRGGIGKVWLGARDVMPRHPQTVAVCVHAALRGGGGVGMRLAGGGVSELAELGVDNIIGGFLSWEVEGLMVVKDAWCLFPADLRYGFKDIPSAGSLRQLRVLNGVTTSKLHY